MSERLVVVIAYDVDEHAEVLSVIMPQVRERMRHPDLPGVKLTGLYAAISDDADAVLGIFEKHPS
jgi:hypothetical protein